MALSERQELHIFQPNYPNKTGSESSSREDCETSCEESFRVHSGFRQDNEHHHQMYEGEERQEGLGRETQVSFRI